MAIDTAAKRSSALDFEEVWQTGAPLPDGAIAIGDRYHLAFSYSGITATPPATIDGVYLVPVDGGQVVFWDAFSGASSYNVYVKAGTTVNSSSYDFTFASADTTRTVTGLTNGTLYAFCVTAVVSAVETDESEVKTGYAGLFCRTRNGVMLNAANFEYTTFALRASYFRHTTGITLSTTSTQAVMGGMNTLNTALGHSVRLFPTIRWDGGSGTPDTGPIGATQLSTMSSRLTTFIGNYSPWIIAVGNEEPSATFSDLTAAQYLAWLEAAYDVAHPLGVLITNGGLVWNGAALCYWAYLLESVSTSAASTFAGIAFPEPDRSTIMAATAISQLDASIQTVITKNRDFLLNVYQATTKMDYMNIHVHWPDGVLGTVDAIQEVFEWYADQTGLQVITNESAIEGENVSREEELLELYDLMGTPIALRYNVTSGQSVDLQETTGELTASGEAWRDYQVSWCTSLVELRLPYRPNALELPDRSNAYSFAGRTNGLSF